MADTNETEKSVKVVTRVTKECWARETKEFQLKLVGIVNKIYQSAHDTYKSFMDEMETDDFVAEYGFSPLQTNTN